MKDIIRHFRGRKGKHRTTGQSLVELAIALPFLIIIFSGLVEFGFMLNYYISLVDATRETARYFSNYDPFSAGTDNFATFYNYIPGYLKGKLEPDPSLGPGGDSTRDITLDPAHDNIIVSVFSICRGHVVARYPTATSTPGEFRWMTTDDVSRFDNARIESRLVSNAPETGVLVIEVFYDYHYVLGIPPIPQILGDKITLYSYTIMPLSAAEPDDTLCPP